MAEREQEVYRIDQNRDIGSVLEGGTITPDAVIPWPVFLEMLERYCAQQNWNMVYESVEDESCAIFYRPG